MKTVYLAGPISGLDFDGATGWRDAAVARLAKHGITGLSPMRGKQYLRGVAELSGHGREYANLGVLSRPRSVITRDRFDATRCDVLLVNMVGAKTVSIGTVMEVAWADLCRTPIVCAMEPNSVHDHMMFNEALGFCVPTLDEALTLVEAILR